MTDQQRYDSLGCYGFTGGHTPNLDRLASEGVVFDHCYVNNTICTPSRASLFTGKHLPGHGVYRLNDILPSTEVLFTQHLRERGYRTALFGKLHVSGRLHEAEQRHPNDGFDIYEWCLEASLHMDSALNGYARWLSEKDPAFYERLRREGRTLLHIPRELHMTHWAAERTIDYLQTWNGQRPFFCMMSVFDPHNPYEDYPLEMEKIIDPAGIPDPVFRETEALEKPKGVQREHEHSYLGPFSRYSLDDLRKMRYGYHASIALIDQEIGRVLEALDASGAAENTLVIFASDHGDMLGDHQLLVKGAYFYDPCSRVPLIVRWPRAIASGQRFEPVVQPHDLAATVLGAAGFSEAEMADWMPDARDLLPAARGETPLVHDYAVCCYRNSGLCDQGTYFDPPIHATMLRDARYKLNVYHDVDGHQGGLWGELYDMVEDPSEMDDLWDQPGHQVIRRRLTETLLDWMAGQQVRIGSRGGDASPQVHQRLVKPNGDGSGRPLR